MKKGTIKEIGPQAIDSPERMIIFFGEEATDTLREYSVIQTIPDSQALVVTKGDQITFGDQTYQVQYVGTVVNQILQTIQHVTFVFDEVPAEDQLSSAIYLTPTVLPKLEVGMQVTIPPAAAALTPAEIAQAAANPGFKRALKFFGMRMRFEGTREWNWTVSNLSERQLLAAAEYARQNQILDRMVNTSERTRTEFDYTQRFPAPHNDILHPTAQGLGLDQAWVYGLIRQESRFITDAQSGVGASGLMQVMPATAKWVAGKIGLDDYGHGMLNDIRTNILLGTNYLNMVLNNADGSQVLATAAYNAGPGRARNWRGLLAAPMEGAVFVESIPFEETRNYVRNVMSNATNYAALFERRPQSLKARLGTITPRGNALGLP